jgi:hypothetical protein
MAAIASVSEQRVFDEYCGYRKVICNQNVHIRIFDQFLFKLNLRYTLGTEMMKTNIFRS